MLLAVRVALRVLRFARVERVRFDGARDALVFVRAVVRVDLRVVLASFTAIQKFLLGYWLHCIIRHAPDER